MAVRQKRYNSTNQKGRSRYDHFVKLDFGILKSAAYRDLSVGARALLVEFCLCYNGRNNGEIGMSVDNAARAIGCAPDTANKKIHELIDHEFLIIRADHSFQFKKGRGKAREFELTMYEYNGHAASRAFNSWSPKSRS